MLKLSLCVNAKTSKLVDVMIGNFTVALPCIVAGNKPCLYYDIKIEGGTNFDKMAELSSANPVTVKMFKQMANLCYVAAEDVAKAATPMEVTTRTCKLLGDLIGTIKSSGVADCALLPNALKLVNAVTILKPENLFSIFSTPNNLKHLLNLKNLII